MNNGKALLLLNRVSGTGHSEGLSERLKDVVRRKMSGSLASEMKIELNHASIRKTTIEFLRRTPGPVVIIAGGGGGSLRAVIEGVCACAEDGVMPGPERVRIACLRMGSGNVFAIRMGVPEDPVRALEGILDNLKNDITVPGCVGRYETGDGKGGIKVQYAATLCGLGVFGSVPGDIKRFHLKFPGLWKFLVSIFGLERFNGFEYRFFLSIRAIVGAVFPGWLELVKADKVNGGKPFRMFMGAVMNFPLKGFPVDPGIGIQDEELLAVMLPARGLLRSVSLLFARDGLSRDLIRVPIRRREGLVISLADRDGVGFFLDEDPEILDRELNISVAGMLGFVPGPDYDDRRAI